MAERQPPLREYYTHLVGGEASDVIAEPSEWCNIAFDVVLCLLQAGTLVPLNYLSRMRKTPYAPTQKTVRAYAK